MWFHQPKMSIIPQGSSFDRIPFNIDRGLGRLDQALYFYNPIINN